MRSFLFLLFAFVLLPRLSFAQTNAPTAGSPTASPAKPHAPATAAQLQAALDQLTQSNRDLLDLLKKQQAVLEDMQFDRRLQSRQIQSLEERLTETLLENTQLQNKISKLEADAAVHPITIMQSPPATLPPQASTIAASPNSTNAAPATAASPPATYLPPPESEGAPGTKSWHRLFTLKGAESKQSDLFQIQGRTWRVLWHNQDKTGKAYQNTSALFISAFPKDDTIPQKICSKLGTGGDSTELQGPGNYYLKIEASGGSWEAAVEDFR